ncbi:polo kinase [Starmerella bacillaris]|uniref:Serine/threonine-protein kinase n=1 Tax=Starmerella bacillaris TaxID=1247836 RepID=A0AAV5RIP0_STABA|nr:polo kinase [Starmerella bacillaris]
MPTVFRTPVRSPHNNERNDVPLGALDGNQQNLQPLAPRASLGNLKPTLNEKPRKEEKKKKPKASSLCQTPPSVILGNGNSYQRGSCIGAGGFARCFQVNNGDGEIYAAKTIAKAALTSKKTTSKLLTEIRIHRTMKHPNIVQYIDCFEDDSNVYMLLEMCSNLSLADMLHNRRQITEVEARFYFVQLLGAVSYIHSRGIVHRDLKLGNIFLDNNMNLKVGDFGLAAQLDIKHPRRYTICGTPNYISPEIIMRPHAHGFASDLWALGIILYAMLVGRPPFQHSDVDKIYDSIKKHDSKFPEPPLPSLAGAHANVSKSARDLIVKLLDPNPNARPSIEYCLRHKWVQKGSFLSSISSQARFKAELLYEPPETSAKNLANMIKQTGLDKLSQGSSLNALESINSDDISTVSTSHILPSSISPPSTKDKYKPVTVPEASAEKKQIPVYDSPVVGQKYREMNNQELESPVAARAGGTGFDALYRGNYTSRTSRGNVGSQFNWSRSGYTREPYSDKQGYSAGTVPLSSTASVAPMATRTSTVDPPKSSGSANSDLNSNFGLQMNYVANPMTVGSSLNPSSGDRMTSEYSRAQDALSGSTNMIRALTESVRKTVNNLRKTLTSTDEDSELGPAAIYTKNNELPVVVTRWADFEENWGVAYCLSDGSVAILFRDKSSMRMDPVYRTYVYFESISKPGLVTHHKITPSTVDAKRGKKVDVLNYVKKYMDNELGHAVNPVHKGYDCANGVIVNTLHKERDYIMFVLTDGTIQFNFKDHFKIILYDNGTKVGLVTDQHQFFAWNMQGAIKTCRQSQFQRVHFIPKLKIMYTAVKDFYIRLR